MSGAVKQKTQLKGVLMLLLTAFVWGSSFVAQSVGMESVEAFTFNGIRTLMGAAVLLPFILLGLGLMFRAVQVLMGRALSMQEENDLTV